MDKLNREYRLGLYEKSMPSTLTWVEKLTIAKKSGFDYLEISIDESDANLQDWISQQMKSRKPFKKRVFLFLQCV